MIYIIGDGGHARVVANLIESIHEQWKMVPREFEAQVPEGAPIAIGIGMKKYRAEICPSLMHRYSVAAKYRARGFNLPSLIHNNAHVASTVKFGDAVQFMLGAIVQPSCIIGDAAIINTGAQVDHDCTIGMGAHIAPGAVICGGCKIGNCTLIGANATVLPGVSVGNHVVVGAAQVVRKDLA